MRITRPFVLLALAVLLAPCAEASRTSVWESNPPSSMTATKSDAAGLLASLAPAGPPESIVADAGLVEPPRFDLGNVVLVESELEREDSFGLGPLDLLGPTPLRGPPPSYPETRVGGFELLPPFRVEASPSLSLWSLQACGFSCREVTSDSRYDPWGLAGEAEALAASQALFAGGGASLLASVPLTPPQQFVLATGVSVAAFAWVGRQEVGGASVNEWVTRGFTNLLAPTASMEPLKRRPPIQTTTPQTVLPSPVQTTPPTEGVSASPPPLVADSRRLPTATGYPITVMPDPSTTTPVTEGVGGPLIYKAGHGDWLSSPWWQTEPHTVYRGQEDGYIGLTDDFTRRQQEWAAEGRTVLPLHDNIPGRLAGRGVEQVEIEAAKRRGDAAAVKQINSIDPSRKDPKAEEMRKRGSDYLREKSGGS